MKLEAEVIPLMKQDALVKYSLKQIGKNLQFVLKNMSLKPIAPPKPNANPDEIECPSSWIIFSPANNANIAHIYFLQNILISAFHYRLEETDEFYKCYRFQTERFLTERKINMHCMDGENAAKYRKRGGETSAASKKNKADKLTQEVIDEWNACKVLPESSRASHIAEKLEKNVSTIRKHIKKAGLR